MKQLLYILPLLVLSCATPEDILLKPYVKGLYKSKIEDKYRELFMTYYEDYKRKGYECEVAIDSARCKYVEAITFIRPL